MSLSFAELFEQSNANEIKVEIGAVISGTVVAIDNERITVDTGLKSEGFIARSEFLNEAGELEVAIGDKVDVVVEKVDNGMGETVLSREKANMKKAGVRLNSFMKMTKSLLVLSLLKLKAALLLRSVLYVRSYLVHWLTFAQYAKPLT